VSWSLLGGTTKNNNEPRYGPRFEPNTSIMRKQQREFSPTVIEHGPGSVVGIATGYRLDGPEIKSRWGRDFPHLSRPALEPTQPPVNGYRVFPGGKERPGRDADPSPLLR
jgi:hypothetical protein